MKEENKKMQDFLLLLQKYGITQVLVPEPPKDADGIVADIDNGELFMKHKPSGKKLKIE